MSDNRIETELAVDDEFEVLTENEHFKEDFSVSAIDKADLKISFRYHPAFLTHHATLDQLVEAIDAGQVRKLKQTQPAEQTEEEDVNSASDEVLDDMAVLAQSEGIVANEEINQDRPADNFKQTAFAQGRSDGAGGGAPFAEKAATATDEVSRGDGNTDGAGLQAEANDDRDANGDRVEETQQAEADDTEKAEPGGGGDDAEPVEAAETETGSDNDNTGDGEEADASDGS
jgi:hypothetical protein